MAGDLITLEIPAAEEQIIIVEAPGIQEMKGLILHIIANRVIPPERPITEAALQTPTQVAGEVHHRPQVIAVQAVAVVLQVIAPPDKLVTNHLADLILLLLAIIVAVVHILLGRHPVEVLQVEEDLHLLLVLEEVEDVNLLRFTLYFLNNIIIRITVLLKEGVLL
jgi:hypothetical protein